MQNRRPGKTLGIALILLGLFFFVGNLVGHWNILTFSVAGIGLLVLSLQSARRRFAVPGAVALAIASFLALHEANLLGTRSDTWLLILLAIAFLSAYVLRQRWTSLYPLSLAAILLFAAVNTVLDFGTSLGGREMIGSLSQWWPALIILLGGLLLVGARARLSTSILLGPALLLVVGITAVLAFDTATQGASWAMFQHGTIMRREVTTDTLDASRATLISVINDTGSVRLYPSDSPQVQIQVVKQVWAPDDTQAQRIFDNVSFRMDRLADRIEIRPDRREAPPIFAFGSSPTLDVEVAVPAGLAVQVTSGAGRIKIDGATRDVTVATRSGKVELTNIGGNVRANLISGDFRAQNVGGEVMATTVSGSIEIVKAAGLREVSTTSGRVIVDSVLRQPASIRTISGDVRLFVSPDSSFRLDYASTSGDVRDELPLTAETRDRHRFLGTYNRGDNVLTVRTVSGDLRVMRSGS
ncbi:MAG: hypothetical protein EPO21_13585 [Chloroflexota bacterium]|nr:MAG: hypothetical protein EPO21_13585 [Chloroflexota bacterium]